MFFLSNTYFILYFNGVPSGLPVFGSLAFFFLLNQSNWACRDFLQWCVFLFEDEELFVTLCPVFRMKRANSLNVLNVGARETQDAQVRALLLNSETLVWHYLNSNVRSLQSDYMTCLPPAVCEICVFVFFCSFQPSRLMDARSLSSSTQNLMRRGSLGGSS